MQFVVGVDIGELGVEAEVAEEAQGFIAEVAALSGHENDLHESEPSSQAGRRRVSPTVITGLERLFSCSISSTRIRVSSAG